MQYINFDCQNEDASKHHFLLPDCHYMMVGQTGCGKTNTLCNMLLQGWLNYDTVTLYTINPEQEKYTMMKDFFDEFSCELLTLADPETVTPVENLDNQDLKVVIFDDIKIDKRNMDKIKEYFSLSRNKNCTCIYLCQSYYDVPKYIRRNTRCFLLFNNLDNRDVRTIAHDQCQGLKKSEFERIYRSATEEPYSFMLIDRTAKTLPERYRKGFDQFYTASNLSLKRS